MRRHRAEDRVTKRFDVRFHIGGNAYVATTSNLSPHGLFIRTPHCYQAGARVRMELAVSDGETIALEGIVQRAVKNRLGMTKNGMGIQVDEPPHRYLGLVKELEG